MSNSFGLILIGLGIGVIVIFVIVVQHLAKNHPDKPMGRIAKKIDAFIDKMPDLSD